MNVGAALVLLKLAIDSGFTVSPKTNGPTTPTVVETGEVKPTCPPGHYASKDTFGNWTCVPIPGGR
jgi:hypothetical protein